MHLNQKAGSVLHLPARKLLVHRRPHILFLKKQIFNLIHEHEPLNILQILSFHYRKNSHLIQDGIITN